MSDRRYVEYSAKQMSRDPRVSGRCVSPDKPLRAKIWRNSSAPFGDLPDMLASDTVDIVVLGLEPSLDRSAFAPVLQLLIDVGDPGLPVGRNQGIVMQDLTMGQGRALI